MENKIKKPKVSRETGQQRSSFVVLHPPEVVKENKKGNGMDDDEEWKSHNPIQ